MGMNDLNSAAENEAHMSEAEMLEVLGLSDASEFGEETSTEDNVATVELGTRLDADDLVTTGAGPVVSGGRRSTWGSFKGLVGLAVLTTAIVGGDGKADAQEKGKAKGKKPTPVLLASKSTPLSESQQQLTRIASARRANSTSKSGSRTKQVESDANRVRYTDEDDKALRLTFINDPKKNAWLRANRDEVRLITSHPTLYPQPGAAIEAAYRLHLRATNPPQQIFEEGGRMRDPTEAEYAAQLGITPNVLAQDYVNPRDATKSGNVFEVARRNGQPIYAGYIVDSDNNVVPFHLSGVAVHGTNESGAIIATRGMSYFK